MRISEDLFSSY